MHLQSPQPSVMRAWLHMCLVINSFEAQGFSDYYRSVKAEPIGKASNAKALTNRRLRLTLERSAFLRSIPPDKRVRYALAQLPFWLGLDNVMSKASPLTTELSRLKPPDSSR